MKIKIIDAPIKDELALFRELNKDEIYEEKGQEVNYALLAHGGTLYILFEPSDGSIDWRMNFSYWRKPYKVYRHYV